MNTQDKIKAIYEKIADKTLSFGCNLKIKYPLTNQEMTTKFIHKFKYIHNEEEEFCTHLREDNFEENEFLDAFDYKIIWHPVMIWDVLDYYRWDSWVNVGVICILDKWNYRRKPLEEQSEECINYIYNLIK